MSSTDKIKGKANEAIGNVKQGVGRVVGSPSLEAEGIAQERLGEAQQIAGDVKDKIRDALDRDKVDTLAEKAKGYANQASGSVKEKIGRAVGNRDLEAEGVAQKAKGRAQTSRD